MTIDLDRSIDIPLYRQISAHIAGLIARELLLPGQPLPPSRELAGSLGVSRNTVVQAYAEMEAEGLLSSRVGRGTSVCAALPPGAAAASQPGGEPLHLEGLFSSRWTKAFSPLLEMQVPAGAEEPGTVNLASSRPDSDLFPLTEFRDSLARAMRRYGGELLTCGSPRGFAPLLEQIVQLLARRGIICGSENLMIVNGSQQALSLLARLFVDPGDTVIMENLTYSGALSVFRSLQANCVGIPVDEEGMRVDVLETVLRRSRAKLVYTIPTFQNPTGVCLAPERRRRLVELCRRHELLIVEDDYAHDLRFQGPEPPPLKAWDRAEGIVYMSGFSETLFPGIRLSYILAPDRIIRRLLHLKESSDLYTNRILQGALLEFCRHGHLIRHIKRKRLALRRRSGVMAQALEAHLPPNISWSKPAGGVYQWLDLPASLDALALLTKTRQQGVHFAPDRLFSVEAWERGGLRLDFGGETDEQIAAGVEVIALAIRKLIAAAGA
jgi:2-aminoadipate transaminase